MTQNCVVVPLIVFSIFINSLALAQVSNDDCAGATSLGTLPQPETCGNGQNNGEGVLMTYNLDNIGAVAENPYGTIVGCRDGADMASPASDVWYSFVASGPELDISITGLTNSSMGLYEGSCGSLIPRGCNNGTATETYSPLTPGSTYYIQISGEDVADQGTFSLDLYNYYACDGCNQGSTVTASPTATNGYYLPGENVQYCITVDNWVQQSTNWFHGVAPTFGPGWDMTTLTPGSTPTSLGGGTWLWTDNVTSSATGLNIPGFGWFIDLNGDGDAGNNFGDTDFGLNGATVGPFPPLCWSITTQQCPAGVSTVDLTVTLNTLADGEIGAWSSIACENDADFTIPAMLLCCEPPTMTWTNETCAGLADGSVTATPTGSVNPWDYVWENSSGTVIQTDNNLNGPSTISNLAPGTYTVTVTDDNGCETVNNFAVVGPGISTVTTITPAGPFCETDASTNLAASDAGGTWSGTGITNAGAGTFDPATATSGTFVITYNVTITGCPASDTESIVVNPAPDPTMTAIGPFCDTDANTAFTVATSGGTFTGTGVSGSNFSPVSAGPGTHTITYSVTVSGCTATDQISVVVNATPDATITPPAAFCPGDPASNLTAATGGGTWSGTGITDANNGTFDPGVAGPGTHNITYSITVNGCTDTDTENIVINAVLDATITPVGPYCAGDAGTTLIAADPGGTWTGTGITNASTGAFDPATAGAGTHVISYVIPGTCGDSDTESIIVNPIPDPTITPSGPFCIDAASSGLVAATAGGTWTGTGITNAGAGTFDPATAGAGTHSVTYSVTVGGCTATDSENIVVNPLPNPAITPAGPFCETATATNLTAATAGGTWTGTGITDGVNGTFDPATAGAGTFTVTYSVTVNGCTDSDTESIVVNPIPDPTITPLTLCENDGTSPLTSATPGGTWTGIGVSGGTNFDPAFAGTGTFVITYSVTVNGCTSTDTENMIVNPVPDPTITPIGPFCETDASTPLISATAGGTWSGSGVTGSNFDPAAAGSGSYVVTYSVTVAGCTDSDTENIIVNPIPDPAITPIGPFCQGDAAVGLTAATAGGTFSGTGVSGNNFDPTASGTGTFNITYAITINGCSDSDTEDVVVNLNPDATITPAAFCDTDTAINLSTVTPGGTWSGTGITNAAAGTFDPLLAGQGTFNITYSVTIGSCTDTDTEDILVNSGFDATINTGGPFCADDAATNLTAANTGGTWAGNGITNPLTGLFNPGSAGSGTHTITYTISGGCGDSDTETFIVNPMLDATITPAGPLCQSGSSINLSSATVGGTWSGTGITDAVNGTFDPGTAGSGTHEIIYMLSQACGDTDTVFIQVNLQLDATITPAGPYCDGDPNDTLSAVDPGGTWSGFGITNNSLGIFSPSTAGPGTYTVTYSISGQCGDTQTESLIVNPVVDATITPAGSYCVIDPVVNLSAVDGGGVWSGTGITNPTTGSFNPNTAGAGTHSIIYSIAGLCGDSDTINIIVIDNPDATITPAGPFCDGAGAVTLSAATGGGNWSGTGITVAVAGTFNPTVAGPGTFVITYSITGSCPDSDTEQIIVNPQMDATITPAGPFCETDPTVTLASVDPGGTWVGTGITDNVNGVFDPSVALAGTHNIVYAISGNCGDTESINIVVNTDMDATINPAGPFCESDPAFTLTAATSGGTWNGVGITNVNTGTFNPFNAGSGTHTITYSLTGSCGDTQTLNIIVNGDFDATITDPGPQCPGDPAFNLTAVSGGGVWAGTGITNTTNGTFDPAVAGPGTHQIIYSINASCGDSDTINVVINTFFDATITPAGPYCDVDADDTLSAVDAGGSWSGTGITNATIGIFSPVAAGAGTHVITYLIPGGCGDTSTVSLVVNPDMDATILSNGPFCDSGGPVILSAADAGGTWSGPGITDPVGGVFDPAVSGMGTHTVTYTISTLCGDTQTQTFIVDGINISNIDTTSVGCNNACDGAMTITATGATQFSIDGGFTYQASPSFNALCAGSYTVVVQSSNGCSDTAIAVVTEPNPLAISFGAFNASCFGLCDGVGIVIPSGGFGGYNYNWMPAPGAGQGTPNAQGLCIGTYTLEITDANNCLIDTTFSIGQPTPFSVTSSSINSSCGQFTGVASIDNVSGATPSYTYQWDSNAFSQTTSSATGLLDGSYNVTISDASPQCDTVVTVVVGMNLPPTATVDSVAATCNDSCDGTTTVNPLGGTGAGTYSYQWSFNTGNQTTQTATGLCLGTYTVTVTDTNFCFVVSNIQVLDAEPVALIPSNDTTICIGTNASISAIASGGNGGAFTYDWGNGLMGQTISVSPGQDTCYNVIAYDVFGCPSSIRNVCVDLMDPISVNSTAETPLCENDTTQLSVSSFGGNGGPYNYDWYDDSGNLIGQNTPLSFVPVGGFPDSIMYYVVASDGCSPNGTDSSMVWFYQTPVVTFAIDSTFGCEPYTATMINQVPNAASCIWDLGDGTIVNSCSPFFDHLYEFAGNYDVTLTVTSTDGCVGYTTPPVEVLVNSLPIPDFTFLPQTISVMDTEVDFTDLSTNDVSNWQWTFENSSGSVIGDTTAQNPLFLFPDEAGTYPVTLDVSTPAGCTGTITQEIIIDPEFRLNIENAFTPNQDGINDYFFPKGVGFDGQNNFKFYIFDRWGDLLFESTSINDPWDGTARELGGSEIVQQDVYIWRLVVHEDFGGRKEHEYVGHVTLIK